MDGVERRPAERASGEAMRRSAGVRALAMVLLAAVGCAPRVYRAADLPAELAAPKAEDLASVDWSRLGSVSTTSDLIEPGDVLDVTIITDYAEQPTMAAPVRIQEDGTGMVPLIGPVQLAGLSLEQAERAIVAEAVARQVFRSPHVVVTMNQRAINEVRVVGAVAEPGVYELRRGDSSLVAALVAAGGLTEQAGPEVEIRRVGSRQLPSGAPFKSPDVVRASYDQPTAAAEPGRIIRVNLVEASRQGSGDCQLRDGDLVYVTQRPPRRIFVTGLVNQAGQYEIPPNEDLYLLDALAMAGARSNQTADTVLIFRRQPGREQPVVIRASVAEAKRNPNANIRLAAGDVISVEETPFTFLTSMLKNFFRIGFSVSSALPLF